MNKYVYLILWWSGALLLAFAIVRCGFINYKPFIGIEFLFTFIGVLIGFALTLFTHVVGLIEKLKTKFELLPDNADKVNKFDALNDIYSEMKDDINFLFISLMLVVITTLVSGLIRNYMDSIDKDIFSYLIDLKNSFILSIFLLCLLAIKDLISISFKLSHFAVVK